jgi:glycosyltransferase involved in cell wall biosynthesis
VQASGLEGQVVELGGVYDEDLRALYSGAVALVFPSIHEGFGWPVIEAQACGCPVFASNRPPLPEVGGAGAFYFDPEDPGGAAAVIAAGLDRLDALRAAGLENVQRYSAEAMAGAYIRIYRRLLDARPQ